MNFDRKVLNLKNIKDYILKSENINKNLLLLISQYKSEHNIPDRYIDKLKINMIKIIRKFIKNRKNKKVNNKKNKQFALNRDETSVLNQLKKLFNRNAHLTHNEIIDIKKKKLKKNLMII